MIDENIIHDKVAEATLITGCRLVDIYYATINIHAGSLLITNDRTIRDNTIKSGVGVYYNYGSEFTAIALGLYYLNSVKYNG